MKLRYRARPGNAALLPGVSVSECKGGVRGLAGEEEEGRGEEESLFPFVLQERLSISRLIRGGEQVCT